MEVIENDDYITKMYEILNTTCFKSIPRNPHSQSILNVTS